MPQKRPKTQLEGLDTDNSWIEIILIAMRDDLITVLQFISIFLQSSTIKNICMSKKMNLIFYDIIHDYKSKIPLDYSFIPFIYFLILVT